MKIAVCIKQVVAREWPLRVNETGVWVRDGDASFEMNEPDAYALEEALRLKEQHGGEVVVCSAGPARVSQVIREGLARGADRAIHVHSDQLAVADAHTTSAALANALESESFELVLTGLQSDDQGFGQTGVLLAERLGISGEGLFLTAATDVDAILDWAASVRSIVTVEEHTIIGGLGSALAEIIAESGFDPAKRFKRIGIPDVFPDQYGTQESLMHRYSISAEAVQSTVVDLVEKTNHVGPTVLSQQRI